MYSQDDNNYVIKSKLTTIEWHVHLTNLILSLPVMCFIIIVKWLLWNTNEINKLYFICSFYTFILSFT